MESLHSTPKLLERKLQDFFKIVWSKTLLERDISAVTKNQQLKQAMQDI